MSYVRDSMFLGGAGGVLYGCYQLHPAAAWVVGGVFVLAISAILSLGKNKNGTG